MHTCEIMPLAFLSMIHFFTFLTQNSFSLSLGNDYLKLKIWLHQITVQRTQRYMYIGYIKLLEISDNQPYKRDLRDKFTHTKHCYAMVKIKIKNV